MGDYCSVYRLGVGLPQVYLFQIPVEATCSSSVAASNVSRDVAFKSESAKIRLYSIAVQRTCDSPKMGGNYDRGI
jgi:hypothetical protein